MGPACKPLKASSLSTLDSFRFLKLSGLNYAIWCQHMQATLQACYLWLVVNGDDELPAKPMDLKPERAED